MKKKLIIITIILFNFPLFSAEVKILEEIIGNGLEIVNHSKVSVHYIGKLENQTEFDNSYKRGEEFQFQIGTRKVILGWETGLLGMKEGGTRTIFIPYELAYGDNGAGELIPPKSNLIFKIEVIKVLPPKYKSINSNQLKLAVTDSSYKILDIRNDEDVANSGKIPNSIIITAFDNNGNFIPDFFKRYQEIVGPNHKVVFVSKRGDVSSILANGFAEQLNQDNIYNLEEGIDGLKKINFKFENFKN
tara:strand:+ start:2544 stop:3281 length:738 start_codon:yes stop_codon:yes gene_type:complete